MKKANRILSLLLVVCMILAMMPAVSAEGLQGGAVAEPSVTAEQGAVSAPAAPASLSPEADSGELSLQAEQAQITKALKVAVTSDPGNAALKIGGADGNTYWIEEFSQENMQHALYLASGAAASKDPNWAKSAGTVTLLKDVDYTCSKDTAFMDMDNATQYNSTKGVTIDLNGKTMKITNEENGYFLRYDRYNVTVQNGTLVYVNNGGECGVFCEGKFGGNVNASSQWAPIMTLKDLKVYAPYTDAGAHPVFTNYAWRTTLNVENCVLLSEGGYALDIQASDLSAKITEYVPTPASIKVAITKNSVVGSVASTESVNPVYVQDVCEPKQHLGPFNVRDCTTVSADVGTRFITAPSGTIAEPDCSGVLSYNAGMEEIDETTYTAPAEACFTGGAIASRSISIVQVKDVVSYTPVGEDAKPVTYSNIVDAVKASQADPNATATEGGEIKLLADCTTGDKYLLDSRYTTATPYPININLNGHTLTDTNKGSSGTGFNTFMITNANGYRFRLKMYNGTFIKKTDRCFVSLTTPSGLAPSAGRPSLTFEDLHIVYDISNGKATYEGVIRINSKGADIAVKNCLLETNSDGDKYGFFTLISNTSKTICPAGNKNDPVKYNVTIENTTFVSNSSKIIPAVCISESDQGDGSASNTVLVDAASQFLMKTDGSPFSLVANADGSDVLSCITGGALQKETNFAYDSGKYTRYYFPTMAASYTAVDETVSYYPTLSDAVQASEDDGDATAAEGGTITVLKDLDLSAEVGVNKGTGLFTNLQNALNLDLGGKTVTDTGSVPLFAVDANSASADTYLNIKNGKLKKSNTSLILAGSASGAVKNGSGTAYALHCTMKEVELDVTGGAALELGFHKAEISLTKTAILSSLPAFRFTASSAADKTVPYSVSVTLGSGTTVGCGSEAKLFDISTKYGGSGDAISDFNVEVNVFESAKLYSTASALADTIGNYASVKGNLKTALCTKTAGVTYRTAPGLNEFSLACPVKYTDPEGNSYSLTSWAEAMTEAGKHSAKGTVEILNDFTEASASIPAGADLTVKFNNASFTVTDGGLEIPDAARLSLITETGKTGGMIFGDEGITVEGELTLTGAEVTAAKTALTVSGAGIVEAYAPKLYTITAEEPALVAKDAADVLVNDEPIIATVNGTVAIAAQGSASVDLIGPIYAYTKVDAGSKATEGTGVSVESPFLTAEPKTLTLPVAGEKTLNAYTMKSHKVYWDLNANGKYDPDVDDLTNVLDGVVTGHEEPIPVGITHSFYKFKGWKILNALDSTAKKDLDPVTGTRFYVPVFDCSEEAAVELGAVVKTVSGEGVVHYFTAEDLDQAFNDKGAKVYLIKDALVTDTETSGSMIAPKATADFDLQGHTLAVRAKRSLFAVNAKLNLSIANGTIVFENTQNKEALITLGSADGEVFDCTISVTDAKLYRTDSNGSVIHSYFDKPVIGLSTGAEVVGKSASAMHFESSTRGDELDPVVNLTDSTMGTFGGGAAVEFESAGTINVLGDEDRILCGTAPAAYVTTKLDSREESFTVNVPSITEEAPYASFSEKTAAGVLYGHLNAPVTYTPVGSDTPVNYFTLTDAMKASQADPNATEAVGGVITVMTNIELTDEKSIKVSTNCLYAGEDLTKAVDIDLNGHTLHDNSTRNLFFLRNNATRRLHVTFRNGTIDKSGSNSGRAIIIYTASTAAERPTITLENMHLICKPESNAGQGFIGVTAMGADITVTNTTFESEGENIFPLRTPLEVQSDSALQNFVVTCNNVQMLCTTKKAKFLNINEKYYKSSTFYDAVARRNNAVSMDSSTVLYYASSLGAAFSDAVTVPANTAGYPDALVGGLTENTGTGTYKTVSCTTFFYKSSAATVTVGGITTSYETVDEAWTAALAASAPAVLKLFADFTVDHPEIKNELTVDLSGKTITGAFSVAAGGSLTLQNGTLDASGAGAAALVASDTLNLSGMTVISDTTAIEAKESAQIEIEGSELVASDGVVISAEGTASVVTFKESKAYALNSETAFQIAAGNELVTSGIVSAYVKSGDTPTLYSGEGTFTAENTLAPKENQTVEVPGKGNANMTGFVLDTVTVSWDEDGDGKADKTETLLRGATPAHDDVTKAATAEEEYFFLGWKVKDAEDSTASKTFEPVTEDTVFVAVFSVTRLIQVAWDVDGDGKVDETQGYHSGETPKHSDPAKPVKGNVISDFVGWKLRGAEDTTATTTLEPVTENTVYLAVFATRIAVASVTVDTKTEYYSDFDAALEKFVKNSTMTLLADYSRNELLAIPDGATLDLGGKTLSSAADGVQLGANAVVCNGILKTQGDGVIAKNAAVIGGNGAFTYVHAAGNGIVTEKASVEIQNAYTVAGGNALQISGGKVTASGSTFVGGTSRNDDCYGVVASDSATVRLLNNCVLGTGSYGYCLKTEGNAAVELSAVDLYVEYDLLGENVWFEGALGSVVYTGLRLSRLDQSMKVENFATGDQFNITMRKISAVSYAFLYTSVSGTETYCDSLYDAVVASQSDAGADAVSGGVITMLGDYDCSDDPAQSAGSYTFGAGQLKKALYIDLNGHTLTHASDPNFIMITTGCPYNLHITFCNGKFVKDGKHAIICGGTTSTAVVSGSNPVATVITFKNMDVRTVGKSNTSIVTSYMHQFQIYVEDSTLVQEGTTYPSVFDFHASKAMDDKTPFSPYVYITGNSNLVSTNGTKSVINIDTVYNGSTTAITNGNPVLELNSGAIYFPDGASAYSNHPLLTVKSGGSVNEPVPAAFEGKNYSCVTFAAFSVELEPEGGLGRKFGTLGEAISYSKPGDSLKLVSNSVVPADTTLTDGLALDLNGYTLSFENGAKLKVQKGAKLLSNGGKIDSAASVLYEVGAIDHNGIEVDKAYTYDSRLSVAKISLTLKDQITLNIKLPAQAETAYPGVKLNVNGMPVASSAKENGYLLFTEAVLDGATFHNDHVVSAEVEDGGVLYKGDVKTFSIAEYAKYLKNHADYSKTALGTAMNSMMLYAAKTAGEDPAQYGFSGTPTVTGWKTSDFPDTGDLSVAVGPDFRITFTLNNAGSYTDPTISVSYTDPLSVDPAEALTDESIASPVIYKGLHAANTDQPITIVLKGNGAPKTYTVTYSQLAAKAAAGAVNTPEWYRVAFGQAACEYFSGK